MAKQSLRQRLGAQKPYVLDAQIGYVLRQVYQRHAALFMSVMGEEITPTQWAALSRLAQTGACSQNLLGRHTAMDASTIKGVVDRLRLRGLVERVPDPEDGRRLLIHLTDPGRDLVARITPLAQLVTEQTLAPLNTDERGQLLATLEKLI